MSEAALCVATVDVAEVFPGTSDIGVTEVGAEEGGFEHATAHSAAKCTYFK